MSSDADSDSDQGDHPYKGHAWWTRREKPPRTQPPTGALVVPPPPSPAPLPPALPTTIPASSLVEPAASPVFAGLTAQQIREVCTGAGLAAGHALLTLRGMCPQPSPGGAAGGSYA
eukprot:gene26231-22134_t